MSYRADNELRGIAAEYAVGLADAGDEEYFAQLLKNHDEFAIAELGAFEETAARLAYALPIARPCDALRSKLLRKIKGREPATPRVLPGFQEEAPGFHVLREGNGKWRATPYEGIEMMLLSRDPASDLITTLVRMAAGSRLPEHHHTREEQCWVLEGEIRQCDNSVSMKGGDFFRAMPGTRHHPITSDTGCLLLIVGSSKDEYVE